MLRLFNKELRGKRNFRASPELLEDLELKAYLEEFFVDPISLATCDGEAIRERNEIIQALIMREDLLASINKLYVDLSHIAETIKLPESDPIKLFRNMHDIYMSYEAMRKTCKAIESCDGLPDSLIQLSNKLHSLQSSLFPVDFEKQWNRYASGAEKTVSASFRIHFSSRAEIERITLTGLYNLRYVKRSLINRFAAKEYMNAFSLISLVPGEYSEMSRLIDPHRETNVLQYFSRSIQHMLDSQVIPIKSQITAIKSAILSEVGMLIEDLQFVVGAVQYAKRLASCTKCLCYAEICKTEDHILNAEDMVHPVLIEQQPVIKNNISLMHSHELAILGGINRGGKTTFLRTVGSVQLLFQMGLPVPAAAAKISPVSGIFSVFSREESTELYQGKLSKELTDITGAICSVDEHSLILCNEPITSTSPTESYLISKEAICILKAKKTRGIWITHLFKLFDDIDGMNTLGIGSKIFSMCTVSVDKVESFIISAGIPDYHSGAAELYQALV